MTVLRMLRVYVVILLLHVATISTRYLFQSLIPLILKSLLIHKAYETELSMTMVWNMLHALFCSGLHLKLAAFHVTSYIFSEQ